MKQFLNDISWYIREFLEGLFSWITVILSTICVIIYYGIMISGDIFILWLIHKVFVWAGL